MNDVIADSLVDTPGTSPAFDRVYFNLHGTARLDGYFVLGIGTYPPTATADAYLVMVPGGQTVQRNLRMSTELDPATLGRIAALQWEVLEPHGAWHLQLDPNPSGVEFDLTWRARSSTLVIPHYETTESAYAHLFQSGRYSGSITVDGKRIDVTGWHGQRDRSKGRRRTHDRLGMHLWIQAQLPGECIGFLYNEDRQGRASHFEGASMREDGALDPIVTLAHALEFNASYEFQGGHFMLGFASGAQRRLDVTSTGRGILMQGAGYNGWHGVARGRDRVEFEEWPLDGSRSPRSLELGITDALCEFHCDGVRGTGISEYALTRSSAYAYRAGGASK